jgi:hypothetical protein
VSTDDLPLGGYPEVDLPDDFADSTPWSRARQEDTVVSPINRAEWMVKVGDGDRHRVAFGTVSGQPVGECDCKGYAYNDGWCAHLAAAFLAYVRQEIVVADLDRDLREENADLWRRYRRDGGDA